ncbi:response regulator [Pigmentiphaga soli]|uniref:histidine kinase n=1 Tax=Pigmentiphaga soli TaxID=1007095 RepID=A0ABP8GR97_9BURK
MRTHIGKSWLGHISLIGKVLIVMIPLMALFMLSTVGTLILLDQEGQDRIETQAINRALQQTNRAIRALYQRQYELGRFAASGRSDTSAYDAADHAFNQALEELEQIEEDDPIQRERVLEAGEFNERWKRTVATPILADLERPSGTAPQLAPDERQRLAQDASPALRTSDIVDVMNAIADTGRATLARRQQERQEVEDVRRQMAVGSLALALLLGVASLYLSQVLITRPLRHLAGLMARLAGGDHAIDVPEQERRDEVGTIARALARFKDMAIETSEQDWLKTSAAAVTACLYEASTHAEFAAALLSDLAPRLGAGIGLFHLYDGERAELRVIGAYGAPASAAPQRARIGEGLVGQCAAERKTIALRRLPADYVRIESGLGGAVPRELLLVPVVTENKLLAVLEFGMLERLDARRRRLLETLAEPVALRLENLDSALHTRRLLEQTQVQASELRASEEELRAQQEELQSSNDELRLKSETLNRQKAMLEALQRDTEDKARALEQANQYKSEFLANMSHELRTPLNSLLILSRDLADNAAGNLSPDQVESARIIHDGGANLLRLINDILDLSKIEAGKLELTLESLDLRKFAAQLERNFRHVAADRGLEFAVTVDDDAPAAIRADGIKLQQIAANLLSNAFKFTRDGSVRVRIGRPGAAYPAFPPERSVAIEVADTGIGIPADKTDKVFAAFEQVDAGTSRQYGGTGLGLTISRQLARLHDGDIALHSEPGRGSLFAILLPQDGPAAGASSGQPAPAAMPPDDRRDIAAGDIAILAIEDDPAFAHTLLDLIHRKGYKGLAAADGETGLRLAREYRPTGILLDVMLPQMDGWAVLQRLKADPATRHIPVHFVSVLDESARGLESGAVGFLTKPAAEGALAAAIERLLHFSPGGKRRLLVVDDEAATRASVLALIAADDIEIDEAASAEEALERMRETGYDCIVLDLGLPGMSGFDFLEHLSRRQPQVPVVVYSGRELTPDEDLRIRQYTDSIVIKGSHASERLLDEVSLFLHSIRRRGPAAAETPEAADAPGADGDLAGRKVLIVDDDMRNVFALSKILRGKGMQVTLAQDGQKALRQLEQAGDVELVLMDVMMPVMDGYETIRRIRQDPRFAQLPVIALTAKAMQGDREKSLEAGASDYLSKPIDVAKLLSMMRVWLNGRTAHEALP